MVHRLFLVQKVFHFVKELQARSPLSKGFFLLTIVNELRREKEGLHLNSA
jgi:hypothetical protein